MSLWVAAPANDATVDASLAVQVEVTSTYEVQTVTAQIDSGTPVSLTFSANYWRGTIDISALPYGSHNVTFKATDLQANVGTTSQPFQRHSAQVTKIVSPPPFGVARPSTNLVATCTYDGAGCSNFSVLVTDHVKLSPPHFFGTDGGINQSADLSRYDGEIVALEPGATNQVLQYTVVDSSQRLIPQVSIETGGMIWDFDDTRILYEGWDPALQPGGKLPVYVRDRKTGKDTLVGSVTFAINDSDIYRHHLNADGNGWTDESLVTPAESVVNNGWTAFRRTSTQGVKQVWVRSPDGVETQLSVFNTNSTIEALSPTGQVMFKNQGKRYLRFPPALPEEINFGLGWAFPRPDGWYVALGNTIFKVSCTDHCLEYDAGAPDAGPVADGDAGTNIDAGSSEGDGATSSGGSSSGATTSGGSSGVTHDAGGSSGDPGGSGSDSGCDIGPLHDVTYGGPLFGLSLGLGALVARRRRARRP